MFPIPILLITFNRPNHTKRVLERILEIKPEVLFVFQDGPRDDNALDVRKCSEVRGVIDRLVHECSPTTEVKKYYSARNLGCGAGPASGITWFFDNVEKGIVMEDDCLAHVDFFGYCENLLNRYNDNESVMFINSTLYDDRWKIEESYGFSRYMVTGAWASWRTFWDGFDLDLKKFDCKAFRKQVLKLTKNRAEADWWYFKALEMKYDEEKKSYWDFQCSVHLFTKSAVTIHPKYNLVSNIGFDEEGTHTLINDGRGNAEVHGILPLVHPSKIEVDVERDSYCFAKAHSLGWIRDRWSFLYRSMLYSKGFPNRILMFYKRIKNN